MIVSKKTRYGVRLMIFLAYKYLEGVKRPIQLSEAAGKEEISEKYLGQIAINLRASGLILSERGKEGGYYLSREPREIKMSDIIKVFEGSLYPIESAECSSCENVGICVAKGFWERIGKGINDIADSITLENLAQVYQGRVKNELLYQI